MKGKGPNIEELFQDTFQDFKAEVPADAWANVQQGLQLAGSATIAAAAAKTGGFLAGKFAALIVGTAVLAGGLGIWAYLDSGDSNAGDAVAEKVETTETNNLKEVEPQGGQPSEIENGTFTETVPAPTTDAEKGEVNSQYSPDASGMLSPSQGKNGLPIVTTDEDKGDPKQTAAPPKISPKGKREEISQEDMVVENRPPVATIGIIANPIEGVAPLTVNFSTANYVGFSSVTWDFGDGSDWSLDVEPEHVYSEAGNYSVKLMTTDKHGRETVENITVQVLEVPIGEEKGDLPAPDIFVPNVLTPNFDNLNDYFSLRSSDNIDELEVRIFASDGRLVFESRQPDFRWDGTDKTGMLMPEGTYFSVLEVKGTDGNRYRDRSAITLIRK